MTRRALLLGLASLLLGGCSDAFLTRLGEVGGPPKVAPSSNPTTDKTYGKPLTLPMPPAPKVEATADSLWRPGGREFFKDQRAHQVGDVLTILVNVNDIANELNNSTVQRNGNEGMDVPNLLGLESYVAKHVKAINMASLVNTGSSNSNIVQGQIQRNEQVTTSLAGIITQVLPNGNMVVVARQQMRVDAELRELIVTGIVRPEDIASDNTVVDNRLAEARIIYGGRGQLSDPQMPRYGQQLMDLLLPF